MSKYMNMDLLKFLLFDVHELEEILHAERYTDYDRESIEMLLDSTKDWADRDFYPFFREADELPARFEDGQIKSHPQLKKIMQWAGENGYIGSIFDYEHGGSQMPHTVALAINHIKESANNHFSGYVGLTTGAANLIITFGSDELSRSFVPKMVSGKWGGTMALTEPQAGSSLSDIATTAIPAGAGYYKIKGQKIFISGGDHEAAENFVHLMLARIEGAPAGTKGISLFVVPKFREDSEGRLEPNDVITAGDFQKLGQRGYSTVHLAMGENDNCRGWLVGEANRGLKYMFQMMNGARIDVGMTAASTATAAYYASLQYARERPQGRKLTSSGKKDLSKKQTLIINHPDVRRMLLFQKSIVEGSLSLLVYCAAMSDLEITTTESQMEEASDLLELLTPIAKSYPSEMGILSVSNGLQVLGGYGFCLDFPLQQYYRDIRIMSIYEGTTGIQALDLLGRKIPMNNGRALRLLSAKINETIEDADTFEELKPYAQQLKEKMDDVQEILGHLLPFALKQEYERYLADATPFLEMLGIVVIGWQWLKMAVTAKKYLMFEKGQFSAEFYETKVHTMQYFYKYEMPKTLGLKSTLMNPETLTLSTQKELIN